MPEIRVLIVDDDPLVRSALSHFVSRDPEINVVAEAETGLEGIEAVEREHPDVVMMDVQMPEMDGIEATGVISERWPEVKILAVTTLDGSDTVLPMLSAPSAKYHLLMKPPVGGMPIRPRDTMVNITITFGMILPMPVSSSARVLPVSWMIAPADINRVFLMKEWLAMCSSAPVKPSGESVDTPKRM
jgi:CheY-like chemotaxis protein